MKTPVGPKKTSGLECVLIARGLCRFNRSMDLRFQVLVCMLAGWLNRQQQDVIEYQREEISVLLEQNGGKPKAFTDSQRRRLTAKAAAIGRKELEELAQLARPDTLRKWFRMLVKEKWTFDSGNRKGRPPINPETEELIIKLLKENPLWGSDRVVGTLKNLGIKVSDTTIDNVRKRHGIPPAPEREKKPNWSKFLSAHWDGLLAADFFTTLVATNRRWCASVTNERFTPESSFLNSARHYDGASLLSTGRFNTRATHIQCCPSPTERALVWSGGLSFEAS